MAESFFAEFAAKMRGAGAREAAVRAFEHNYDALVRGQAGLISESAIQPVEELPRLEQRTKGSGGQLSLLSKAVVVKLNGGLGTSMGLEGAKSLLQVKSGLTFLDFIVRQVIELRRRHGVDLRLLLMNSFYTSRDTLAFLRKYPELGEPRALEVMQSQAPKIDAQTLRPACWPANPQLEWCPPGHGDFYPSLLDSGWLKRLLDEGINYLFISNSDNLGASLDLGLLTYFAESGKPFLMEVAERTAADRKGGHLARRNGLLLLRESAQCPEADAAQFQDISRHRFFNTNILGIRLDSLAELLKKHTNGVPLPELTNRKTLDPRDKGSPAIFQLETAMGAAIECFENSGAIVVPRNRFAPVKTTGDLLALRSDAYAVTQDWRVVLAGDNAQPPTIDLDPAHYKLVDQLDRTLAEGIPSLKDCKELVVRGPVVFGSNAAFAGKVRIENRGTEVRVVPAGKYENRGLEL